MRIPDGILLGVSLQEDALPGLGEPHQNSAQVRFIASIFSYHIGHIEFTAAKVMMGIIMNACTCAFTIEPPVMDSSSPYSLQNL